MKNLIASFNAQIHSIKEPPIMVFSIIIDFDSFLIKKKAVRLFNNSDGKSNSLFFCVFESYKKEFVSIIKY